MTTIRTRVVVIGTGFSGIGMGIKLKEAGHHDFVILEKADDIGGTWRDNTYPGCACDVPSHLYSFSFEPNTEWSKMWSGQPEILAYLRGVVDKHGLREHIRFGRTCAGGRWDPENSVWHIDTVEGDTVVAQFVVSGVGALHIPNVPALDGVETFDGPAFHSAQWDHSVDLTGKRVAVIGTGASAVQFVPQIVDRVAELQLYQRTPAWVTPRKNFEIPSAARAAFRRLPGVRRLFRDGVYLFAETLAFGLNGRPYLMKPIENAAKKNIAKSIDDPALREKLTPDYRIGCKRILGSDTYYPALNREHTQVITDGIEKVTPRGIVARDGIEREVDVIVYATGFHVTDGFESVNIAGLDGTQLVPHWQENGIRTHLGITAAGYPNAFFLLGPNTGLGHNSVVFMIEQQISYVIEAIGLVDSASARAIMVRDDAQARFDTEIHRKLSRGVWSTGGCTSWYLDASGVNRTIWPGGTWQYWLRTRSVDPADYEFLGVRRDTPTDLAEVSA
ncbi:monooxygenase [Rhodococcoides trifolii]|uniref:Monooxygenase n=1 Tax=Rhodococcoides trifolii TaxID=908250 RepID=A0A917CR00_9NOCA|nr:NAD(P)/FAD-dependent oxidoreductase [Rhodococcus trifolii]GGF95414.1 monooxygenase [Rhodococcus trifolii]